MFYRPTGSLNQRLDGRHYRGIVVDVDICISCGSVVLPEVEKCRITKTSSELSITPGPWSVDQTSCELPVVRTSMCGTLSTISVPLTFGSLAPPTDLSAVDERRFSPRKLSGLPKMVQSPILILLSTNGSPPIRRRKRDRTDHHHPK